MCDVSSFLDIFLFWQRKSKICFLAFVGKSFTFNLRPFAKRLVKNWRSWFVLREGVAFFRSKGCRGCLPNINLGALTAARQALEQDRARTETLKNWNERVTWKNHSERPRSASSSWAFFPAAAVRLYRWECSEPMFALFFFIHGEFSGSSKACGAPPRRALL